MNKFRLIVGETVIIYLSNGDQVVLDKDILSKNPTLKAMIDLELQYISRGIDNLRTNLGTIT